MPFELVYVDDISTFLEDGDLNRLYEALQDSYTNIEYMTPRYIKDNIRVVLCPDCYSSRGLYAKTSDAVIRDKFQCVHCMIALGESGYYLNYHDVIIKKLYPRWRWRRGAV